MAFTLPIRLPLGLPNSTASLPLPTELGVPCPPEGLPCLFPNAQLYLRDSALSISVISALTALTPAAAWPVGRECLRKAGPNWALFVPVTKGGTKGRHF